MSDLIPYVIEPDTEINDAAAQMLTMAKFTGQRVIAQFNQYVLVAHPGDTKAKVINEVGNEH